MKRKLQIRLDFSNIRNGDWTHQVEYIVEEELLPILLPFMSKTVIVKQCSIDIENDEVVLDINYSTHYEPEQELSTDDLRALILRTIRIQESHIKIIEGP